MYNKIQAIYRSHQTFFPFNVHQQNIRSEGFFLFVYSNWFLRFGVNHFSSKYQSKMLNTKELNKKSDNSALFAKLYEPHTALVIHSLFNTQ